MTRNEIEEAVYEASHDMDFKFIPWSIRKVVDFTVEQVNRALEEAASKAGVNITYLKIP